MEEESQNKNHASEFVGNMYEIGSYTYYRKEFDFDCKINTIIIKSDFFEINF